MGFKDVSSVDEYRTVRCCVPDLSSHSIVLYAVNQTHLLTQYGPVAHDRLLLLSRRRVQLLVGREAV